MAFLFNLIFGRSPKVGMYILRGERLGKYTRVLTEKDITNCGVWINWACFQSELISNRKFHILYKFVK